MNATEVRNIIDSSIGRYTVKNYRHEEFDFEALADETLREDTDFYEDDATVTPDYMKLYCVDWFSGYFWLEYRKSGIWTSMKGYENFGKGPVMNTRPCKIIDTKEVTKMLRLDGEDELLATLLEDMPVICLKNAREMTEEEWEEFVG